MSYCFDRLPQQLELAGLACFPLLSESHHPPVAHTLRARSGSRLSSSVCLKLLRLTDVRCPVPCRRDAPPTGRSALAYVSPTDNLDVLREWTVPNFLKAWMRPISPIEMAGDPFAGMRCRRPYDLSVGALGGTLVID